MAKEKPAATPTIPSPGPPSRTVKQKQKKSAPAPHVDQESAKQTKQPHGPQKQTPPQKLPALAALREAALQKAVPQKAVSQKRHTPQGQPVAPAHQPASKKKKKRRSPQAQLEAWLSATPSKPAKVSPLNAGLGDFYQQAHKLAAVDHEIAEKIIKKLTSPSGLVRVTELIKRPFTTWSDALLEKVFDQEIIPFFLLLCLKNFDQSPSTLNIYELLFGNNGKIAILVFKATARYLTRAVRLNTSGDIQMAIASCMAVFAKVIETNESTIVAEQLQPTVDSMAKCVGPSKAGVKPISKSARKNLQRIQTRLHPENNTMFEASTIFHKNMSELSALRDLPGQFSRHGPRHDNDHELIQNIQLLPALSEIKSSRTPYLPGLEPNEWHIEGIAGLLDRQFRLFRKDIFGHPQEAVKLELERQGDRVLAAADRSEQHSGTHHSLYLNVRFENFGVDAVKGLEFAISFEQPHGFRGQPDRRRLEMWQESQRLGSDTLVCLVDARGCFTTLMVVTLPTEELNKKLGPKTHRLHKQFPRHGDRRRANAVIRFAQYDDKTVHQIFNFFDSYRRGQELSLLEFPGVPVPAFLPTLAALQDMSVKLDLSFADVILQRDVKENSSGIASPKAAVSPPAYAMKSGFQYNPSAISNPPMELRLGELGQPVDFDMAKFKRSTGLDAGQADALISSLRRSFAITQGPPGTGKSYTGVKLIKVLLDNKARGSLGPIILVSYTNHALDQLLEHLLDAGIEHIIRIGSRSQSERISELTLNLASKAIGRTKKEKEQRKQLNRNIEAEGMEMQRLLSEIGVLGTQQSIAKYLSEFEPEHYKQLFGNVDEDGYEPVDHQTQTLLSRWLNGNSHPSYEIADSP